MSQVLYRKYRPNSFKEIKGQEHVVPILVESILQNKISHAYLFSGPRGSGKTTIARLMAKSINCSKFEDLKDVCNECEYCLSINAGNNIDIIEMDAASNRGIEEIRSLKDTVNFMPSFLKKKIYIIDEAHMLTKEAFNALLKTLEEPPEHVVFILATTEAHKLPITILSRVTRFDFKFGSENEIINKLKYIVQSEGVEVEDGGLELIFRYSGGSFRDSESLLGKILLSNSTNKISLEDIRSSLGVVSTESLNALLDALLNGKPLEINQILSEISTKESNISLVIDQLLTEIHNRIKTNPGDNNSLLQLSKLAKLVIALKSDLRDFQDKALILHLGFVRIAQQLSVDSLQSSENQKDKEIRELPKQEIKKTEIVHNSHNQVAKLAQNEVTQEQSDESKSQEVVKQVNRDNNFETFKASLIEGSIDYSARLKSMLKSSQITQEGGSIVIKASNKLNISYMSQRDVRDLITKIMNQVFDKPLGLSFIVDETLQPSVSSNKPESQEAVKPVIQDNKNIEKKEKVKDNSALVENLLG